MKSSNDTKTRLLFGLMNAHSQGISGGDVWFLEVLKRLINFKKVVVTSSGGRAECLSRGLEVQFEIVGPKKYKFPLAIEYLLRTFSASILLLRKSADVVYASSDFFPDVVPALLSKRRNANVLWVQKIYHLAPSNRRSAWLVQKFSHFLIRWGKADLVLVDNKHLADQLAGAGFEERTIHVVQPGVEQPNTTIQHVSKKEGAIYLGRVHPAKGMEALIKIWHLVCAKLPHAHLTIIGFSTNEYLAKLTRLVKELNLEGNIKFLGFLPSHVIVQLLAESRVFVTASTEEGYGISLLESLSVGTPVVCWDIPAFHEAFGQLVTLTTLGDQPAFCDNVIKLMTEDRFYTGVISRISKQLRKNTWDMTANQEQRIIETKIVQLKGEC